MFYNNISILLACVNVNHIYDRPGYLTCERVPSNDPCLTDQVCEIENMCPGSDGLSTDRAAYLRLIADQKASGTYEHDIILLM